MDSQERFLGISAKLLLGNYNPSSNIVEGWHRTIVSILRTMDRKIRNEWDLGVKSACLAYNTKVHSSTSQTPFLATFEREANSSHPLGLPNPQTLCREGCICLDRDYTRKVSNCLCWYEGETITDGAKERAIL